MYIDIGFIRACEYGQMNVVKYFMDLHPNGYKRANLKYKQFRFHENSFRSDEAFLMACKNGHLDVVIHLLDISEYHVYTACYENMMIYLTQGNHFNIIDYILSHWKFDHNSEWILNYCESKKS